jgi:hypothetical protein
VLSAVQPRTCSEGIANGVLHPLLCGMAQQAYLNLVLHMEHCFPSIQSFPGALGCEPLQLLLVLSFEYGSSMPG